MHQNVYLFRICVLFTLIVQAFNLQASDIQIQRFRYFGPYIIKSPIIIDSLNVNSTHYSVVNQLDDSFYIDFSKGYKIIDADKSLSSGSQSAIHYLGCSVNASEFVKAEITIEGLKNFRLYVDGTKSDGKNVVFNPGSHQLIIKCLTLKDSVEYAKVTLKTEGHLSITEADKQEKLYSINEVIEGERIRSVSLSNSGRFLISLHSNTFAGGTTTWTYRLKDLQTKRVLAESDKRMSWLPGEDRYYITQKGNRGTQIVAYNPLTNEKEILCEQAPAESYTFLPNKSKTLIVTHRTEGPKDDKDVHEYLTPDDRQPGWRDRYSLQLFDMNTCQTTPLTYGNKNVYLTDVSQDGKEILVTMSRNEYGKRPTTLFSLLKINLETLQTDTIVARDGYISNAYFSPDGDKILVIGSAEAFNGIGMNLPQGLIPNSFDYQLFVVDTKNNDIKPITKSFNPSILQATWNIADNNIYFTANDRDCINLFVCSPKQDYKITKIDIPEEVISNFSLADMKKVGIIVGESASNSDRLYSLDLTNRKVTLLEDISYNKLKDIKLGSCKSWDFVNTQGDTICGRYYLPPHFDATKKYPMIVYYYGGCTPVPRHFESRYPFHAFAAQDYVVYVLQPSGCAGFGQEFASRHVNTAGRGPAEDIIEGTKEFIRTHSFVDADKVGCMGASYGGFMTQYLQTQTDIFAAAVSHAGISDHTSYWGEGYWGYSYSEVSMADSYPWTRKDLYVDQSPLYNADKIHTPILFLHGTADTNVPVGESIQMYTALKLLNRPTSLVVIEGENHGINEYSKRIKWQNSIYAWFAKWLKDDTQWWNQLYPEKNL